MKVRNRRRGRELAPYNAKLFGRAETPRKKSKRKRATPPSRVFTVRDLGPLDAVDRAIKDKDLRRAKNLLKNFFSERPLSSLKAEERRRLIRLVTVRGHELYDRVFDILTVLQGALSDQERGYLYEMMTVSAPGRLKEAAGYTSKWFRFHERRMKVGVAA